jgi:hypothetical protein
MTVRRPTNAATAAAPDHDDFPTHPLTQGRLT